MQAAKRTSRDITSDRSLGRADVFGRIDAFGAEEAVFKTAGQRD